MNDAPNTIVATNSDTCTIIASRKPTGLINGYNVCFLNSVLQLLCSIRSVLEYVDELEAIKDDPSEAIKNMMMGIAKSNKPFITAMHVNGLKLKSLPLWETVRCSRVFHAVSGKDIQYTHEWKCT